MAARTLLCTTRAPDYDHSGYNIFASATSGHAVSGTSRRSEMKSNDIYAAPSVRSLKNHRRPITQYIMCVPTRGDVLGILAF